MNFFVTGTDTDIGKTVVSSWLALHLDADYWKPIQSGTEPETDSKTVLNLTGFDYTRVHASTYVFPDPLSPHEAAKRAEKNIKLSRFRLPKSSRPLVVEGAGGLLVPLNEQHYMIDLILHLGLPVVLVCRSTLGTINHTLLSLESLRSRGIPIAGAVLVGPRSEHNRQAIAEFGKIEVIGELPIFDSLSPQALKNHPLNWRYAAQQTF